MENFDTKNVGKYFCKGENSLGAVSQNVSVTIRLAPTVKVVPDKLTVRNGEQGSLSCVVEGNYGDFSILWKDDSPALGNKVR